MADSELGDLRRPPRSHEYRVERLTRWRSQGLANGAADTAFPVDVFDDEALFADGGTAEADAGETPSWYCDTYPVTSSSTTFALTYSPIEASEVVRLNGLTLTPGVDYTIDGNTLTLDDPTDLLLGIGAATWDLAASYAHFDEAAPGPEFGYVLDLATFDVTEPVLADDVAFCIVDGTVTAISGVYATWTKVREAGGYGTCDLWVGQGVGTGDNVSFTGRSIYGRGELLVVYRGAGAGATVSVRDVGEDSGVIVGTGGGTESAPAATAQPGDIVLSILRLEEDFISANLPGDPADWTSTGFDVGDKGRSYATGGAGNGVGVVAGTAGTAGSVDTTFTSTNGPGGWYAANYAIEVTA